MSRESLTEARRAELVAEYELQKLRATHRQDPKRMSNKRNKSWPSPGSSAASTASTSIANRRARYARLGTTTARNSTTSCRAVHIGLGTATSTNTASHLCRQTCGSARRASGRNHILDRLSVAPTSIWTNGSPRQIKQLKQYPTRKSYQNGSTRNVPGHGPVVREGRGRAHLLEKSNLVANIARVNYLQRCSYLLLMLLAVDLLNPANVFDIIRCFWLVKTICNCSCLPTSIFVTLRTNLIHQDFVCVQSSNETLAPLYC